MTARFHAILSRSKDHPARRAKFEDFVLGEGTAFSADAVVKEPGWSLYCLHQPTQQAVYVRVPPDCNLSATPFMRMAQFAHATGVALIPWQGLDQLAAQVTLPRNLILVFNIGRSGTTLVSQMLGLVENVVSLSEPNCLLDATMNRAANGANLTRKLIAACTTLQCVQPNGLVPETLAFKTYSQSLFNCADYHAVFPQAKYVFLYRDAVGWANSLYKMAQGFGMAAQLDRAALEFVWSIASAAHDISVLEQSLPRPDGVYHHEDISAASWALHLSCYMDNLAAGVPFLALRYNEIITNREESTQRLLRHCGLPTHAAHAALQGFERDSQDGSGIGQDNKAEGFTPAHVGRFLSALARQKRFTSADVRLPDMYDRTAHDQ